MNGLRDKGLNIDIHSPQSSNLDYVTLNSVLDQTSQRTKSECMSEASTFMTSEIMKIKETMLKEKTNQIEVRLTHIHPL